TGVQTCALPILDEKAPDGSIYRPDIVWFGEDVPMFEKAIEISERADVFLIVGTSLQVYPAANLVSYTKPNTPVYVIDKKIPFFHGKDFIAIEESAGKGMEIFFSQIMELTGN